MKFLNQLFKGTFIASMICFAMIFISMIPYGLEERYWDSPFDAPPFLKI